MLYYDKLRYRLMPYIYSLAGRTYHDNYTIMRGLVMDFPRDNNVVDIGDQYMFGPSLLVCPVYTYEARSREVYLPSGSSWYDLYSGKIYAGGQHYTVDAPYERMPVFVKSGSILPAGPEIQYTGEKPADPITLFVYVGADGLFELYEDEGVNYNYEQDKYSIIPVHYHESRKELTIGERKGSFTGMPEERVFNIVWVDNDKPVGVGDSARPHQVIRYNGQEVMVKH
jgi:alpha-D-xyloside xylohydrolase